MVPSDSCRISRVPHYSGAGSAVFGISRTGLSPSAASLSRLFRYPSVVPFSPVLQPRRCRNTDGLGSCAFARHYWRNHCCFLFLRVLRCFSSPGWPLPLAGGALCSASGCPIRTSAVMAGICPLPRLFAACHVLLRLREPRHPPCALVVPLISSKQPTSDMSFSPMICSCETLLCFYSCLLTIQNLNLESLPALSLSSEKWRITDSNR